MDYAKAAEQQMKQLNQLVNKNMTDLTEMLLPQKTAVIKIADQDNVTMNLTGKAGVTITLVFQSKQAAEQKAREEEQQRLGSALRRFLFRDDKR